MSDEIDRMVSDSIESGGTDDYGRELHDRTGDVRCSLCKRVWHGLPFASGCPGPWASEEEIKKFQENAVRVPASGLSDFFHWMTAGNIWDDF